MITKLADLILDNAIKRCFASNREQPLLRLELYKNAEALYNTDPALFNSASLELLDDDVPLLKTEPYQARMECADIWHKNSFDVQVFRIRYYLNISPESDSILLHKKIKAAFSCDNSGFVSVSDARRGYEGLFYQTLRSDAAEDHNLRSALSNLVTADDIANDIDGVLTYVMISEELLERENIPSYLKNIYVAVTSISVIQGDGLHGWLIENGIDTLRDLCIALRELGLQNTSIIMDELYECINSNYSAQDLESEDEVMIEQINLFETRLMESLDNEDVVSFAEKYLSLHKGSL